ncbi:calmodulin-binding transcription activator 2-like isoform X2 [Scleropages formosus]|uniref:calmodulin-binding transcription activator 2-like isoform X2 n=1 Tax=Scleropages formosus TaxID=113540 RepID=UPI0010FA8CF4|nr:calmodulin-binding transcription activator 2 isoform X2 [Scleropages formosus]
MKLVAPTLGCAAAFALSVLGSQWERTAHTPSHWGSGRNGHLSLVGTLGLHWTCAALQQCAGHAGVCESPLLAGGALHCRGCFTMNNKETTTESDSSSQMKVFLPNKLLECLPRPSALPKERLRWNTNEEIASYLISFDRHEEWLSCSLKTRPVNGSVILYNRKKVKYRKDGYCWKKRKDGKTTREDHMKLKVQGMECLYGCYVHSSIVPTFHRRCYWLLQNPDIVLVHYLNVPSLEDCGKVSRPLLCAVAERRDSLRWTREELLSQLKPMFHSIKWSCSNGNANGTSEFSIEQLVQHIMDSQQTKPQPRTHACLCSTALASAGANIPHRCNSTKHRIISPKLPARPLPCHALAEVQNLAASEGVCCGGSREAEEEDTPTGGGNGRSGSGGGKTAGSFPQPQAPVTVVQRLDVRSPPVPQDSVGVSKLKTVSSPGSTDSSATSSSPLQPHQAPPLALGNGSSTARNGFYGNQRSLATVTLPQNAVIVMTTAINRAKDGEDSKRELSFNRVNPASPRLSVGPSSCLVLSPVPPNSETPPPPASTPCTSISVTNSRPHSSSTPTPGVATLSLTLLPSPVIGGLLLTDRLLPGSDSSAPLSLLSPHPPSPAPSPLPAAPQPLPPCSSSPPPSAPTLETPPAFDPDSFLNSPKQGQTYGGPSHTNSLSTLQASPSSLSPPLSSSPCAPSLSLSPSSPPSSSSPSSLSSFSSETERGKDGEREVTSFVTTSTSLACSLSLSPHPPFALSPSHTAPPELPLCLEPSLSFGNLEGLEADDPAVVGVDGQREGQNLDRDGILGGFLSPEPPHSEQGVDPVPECAESQSSQLKSTTVPQPGGPQLVNDGLLLVLQHPEQQKQDQTVPSEQPELEVKDQSVHVLQYALRKIPEEYGQRCEEAPQLDPQLPFAQRGLSQQSLKREGPGHQLLVLPKKPLASQPAQTQQEEALRDCPLGDFGSSHNGLRNPWIQVKEEQLPPPPSSSSSSSLGCCEVEETPMDTNSLGDGGSNAGKSALGDLSVNSRSTPAGAEQSNPFVISFDSQFPDLISELIAEDCQTNQTEGTAPELQAHPVPFPFPSPSQSHSEHLASEGHYIMPPQSTSVSSSLSFPDFTTSITSQGQSSDPGTEQRPLATITDFSPEWSYPEGGVKVLITGPWTQTAGRYSCVFDRSTVPASLIQPGVLRCYCPAHAAGLVTLRVLEDTGLASSSVLFEYRPRCASSLPSSQLDWLSLDDNQFRMSILERLEQMEKRMAEMAASDSQRQQVARSVPGTEERVQAPQSGLWFEQRIVAICERMMAVGHWASGGQPTDSGERLLHSTRHRGMTLLHLAAAQGYTQLIHTLIHWRTVNPGSLDLEQEVDPLNVDHFSCTPLMWACALGHHKAAVLLFHWNSLALDIPDSLGRLPLGVARSRGHTRLALCLEELRAHCALPEEEFNPGQTTPLPPPPSPLSTSPDTGLSSSSSLASPGDAPSRSPSSAYSSGSVPLDSPLYSPADPMDTSAPSLSTSSPPPSPPLSLPPWDEAFGEAGQPRDPTLPMEFESAGSLPGTPHSQRSDFEAELLGFGEDSENQEYLPAVEEIQVDMVTLAEQIIEATPERIKQEEFPRSADSPLRERRDNPAIQSTMPWLATYLDTVETMAASSPSRCVQPMPLAPTCRSPRSPRPPSSSASWAEFLGAAGSGRVERDFALLTLSDIEQRELYEAARVIQNAFRRYKGRRLKEQQDMAAAVIQRCYRKYKQYALYKKMTQAAILIQSKFRSYYEQKKFQQSRRAAVLIQQYYRSYKEYERLKQNHRGPTALNTKIRGSFLTKKQDQAARKIMRFLRRCRHRIKELKQSRELESLQARNLAS